MDEHEHEDAGGDVADAACGRCGGPIEKGQLTTNRGRWWGGAKIGWLPWPPRKHHWLIQGEPLVETAFTGVRHPAYRCPRCHVVWFRYVPY